MALYFNNRSDNKLNNFCLKILFDSGGLADDSHSPKSMKENSSHIYTQREIAYLSTVFINPCNKKNYRPSEPIIFCKFIIIFVVIQGVILLFSKDNSDKLREIHLRFTVWHLYSFYAQEAQA